ncbi:hypothetical protein PCE1_000490 [Barthelona sp. PCE]
MAEQKAEQHKELEAVTEELKGLERNIYRLRGDKQASIDRCNNAAVTLKILEEQEDDITVWTPLGRAFILSDKANATKELEEQYDVNKAKLDQYIKKEAHIQQEYADLAKVRVEISQQLN